MVSKFYIDTPQSVNWNTKQKDAAQVSVLFGHVIFAGKIYPFAGVHKYQFLDFVRTPTGPFNSVFYDFESYKKFEAEYNRPEETYRKYRKYLWNNYSIESFFKQRNSDRFMSIAVEYQRPIISISQQSTELCPILEDLQFFKALDPWQAYQELSMFMGNLASRDDTPIKVSDKDRIAQYGFNRWSFRKQSDPFVEKKQ